MPFFKKMNIEAYRAAARLLADGQTEIAIEKLREIIEEEPKHKNALIAMGVALIQIQEQPSIDNQQTTEAFEYLDKAASLSPKNPVAVFNKGVCLREIGMLHEALVQFDAVLAIEKKNPLSILHKAEINYELGNWREALKLAKLALARDPGLAGSMEWVKDAMKKAGLMDEEGNVIGTLEEEPDGNT